MWRLWTVRNAKSLSSVEDNIFERNESLEYDEENISFDRLLSFN